MTHLESTKERTSLVVTASSTATSRQNTMSDENRNFCKKKRKEKYTRPLTLGINTINGCNVPRESKYRRELAKLKY